MRSNVVEDRVRGIERVEFEFVEQRATCTAPHPFNSPALAPIKSRLKIDAYRLQVRLSLFLSAPHLRNAFSAFQKF